MSIDDSPNSWLYHRSNAGRTLRDGFAQQFCFPAPLLKSSDAITADTSVASALSILRAEPGLQDARILERDGQEVEALTTIGDLASSGFMLSMKSGERVVRLSPLPWVPSRSVTQGGVLTLEEVVRRGSYLRVTKALRSRRERTLRVAAFLNLAADAGVPPDEGRDLLRGLHLAGVVLHFHRHPDATIRDTVFLKPEETLDSLYAHFGLEGPNKAFVREQREARETALARHRARLADKTAARSLVEREAGVWAMWSNRLGFAGMTGGVALYGWLTFDYLSWDIMEPVTYATGAVASVAAYWWWVLSDRELAFSSVAETVMTWRRRNLYRGILADSIAPHHPSADDPDAAAMAVTASAADPAVAYEQELAQLTLRVAAEEAEVDLLSRTEFNPSLLQYYDAVESVTALPGTVRLGAGSGSGRAAGGGAAAAAEEEVAVRRAAQLVRLVTAAAGSPGPADEGEDGTPPRN